MYSARSGLAVAYRLLFSIYPQQNINSINCQSLASSKLPFKNSLSSPNPFKTLPYRSPKPHPFNHFLSPKEIAAKWLNTPLDSLNY